MIEGCEDQEDEEFPMYEEGIVIDDTNEEEGPVSTKIAGVGGLVEEQHFSHHLQYYWQNLQLSY